MDDVGKHAATIAKPTAAPESSASPARTKAKRAAGDLTAMAAALVGLALIIAAIVGVVKVVHWANQSTDEKACLAIYNGTGNDTINCSQWDGKHHWGVPSHGPI